jgi:lysophospholipase L1-like esterase
VLAVPWYSRHLHTLNRHTGANLGMEKFGYSITWIGMGGMKLKHLIHIILGMVNLSGIPDIILIHCGANDVGEEPSGKLMYDMKVAFSSLKIEILPGCSIIFSEMLPRRTCRSSNSTHKMEKTRKRVNRGARSCLLKQLGYVIKHPDFEDKYNGLFAKDGVHLSFIGYDIFINTLQGALETFFSNLTCHAYN